MTQVEKSKRRLIQRPKDFNWNELTTLLKYLGFTQIQGSGSRVKFFHNEKDCLIQLHQPHPSKILKPYMINKVLQALNQKDLL